MSKVRLALYGIWIVCMYLLLYPPVAFQNLLTNCGLHLGIWLYVCLGIGAISFIVSLVGKNAKKAKRESTFGLVGYIFTLPMLLSCLSSLFWAILMFLLTVKGMWEVTVFFDKLKDILPNFLPVVLVPAAYGTRCILHPDYDGMRHRGVHITLLYFGLLNIISYIYFYTKALRFSGKTENTQ